MSFLLLTLLLIAFGVNVWRSLGRFRRLTAGEGDQDPHYRRDFYRRGLVRSVTLFLGGSFLVLMVTGRLSALAVMPEPLVSLAQLLRAGLGSVPEVLAFSVAAVWVAVVGLASLMGGWQLKQLAAHGNAAIGALLPRTWTERLWCGLISLNAGIAEELFFRLALPLLLIDVTGQPGLSLSLSLLIFGLGHAYQGVWGIVVTTLMGGMLALVYLYSGQIAWAMVVHAGVDLWSLVAVPLLIGWGKAKGPASPPGL